VCSSDLILFTSNGLTGDTVGRCIAQIRDAMVANVVEQDMEYFDRTSTGVLVSRLSEDVSFAFDTYVDKLMTALQFSSQIIGAIIIAMVVCWRVTLSVVGIIPVALVTYYVGEYIVGIFSQRFKDTSSFSAEKANEVMSAFRTVKSAGCELYEASEYAKSSQSIHDVVKGVAKIHAGKTALLSLLSWGVIAPLMYYTVWLLLRRPFLGLGVGDLAILVNCFSNIGISIAMMITAVDDFSTAKYSAAKVLAILEAKPTKKRTDGAELRNPRGKIEFRDVCFKYPGSDTYALDHLTFTVNEGETIALVGESGCGKSTTLSVLQQFYPIESGSILIDGIDTSTLSSISVRSSMSVVSQMPVLFSMSILDNIRYGNPEAAEERVTEASRIGNAHDFVMEIPQNYNASVEQTSLSGGQKQRLCIARAILADRPILLLDEATAALDTESEQLVQESLERCRSGKTTIVVAHRLATVRHADRILVFEHGCVIETGTHDELLSRDGSYANLIKFQLQ
jgi:ABC-type multidrug transport system fused ATPase/permease subunit